MTRWMVLISLVVCCGWGTGMGTAAARPLGQPEGARVLGFDADTADTALLRWEQEEFTQYRVCFSTNYAFLDFVSCFDAGSGDEWPVRVPEDDGGVFYFTLQACRDGECAEPVRAGAVGRRVADGWDFYGVAVPLPDGRVRLGGFAGAGPVALRYYRAAAGTAARLHSTCPDVRAGEGCGPAEIAIGGSLAGVGAMRAGVGERGVTFQLRDTPSIAFMFDDGTGIVAGGRYIMQSILDNHGVKGSFFLTGRAMQTYPTAVRALVAGGHRVGNHSWSHPYLTALNDAAIAQEMDLTESQFRAIVPGGTLKPCFRAPYGDVNERVLTAVRGRGFRQYTQSVSSVDYAGISANAIITNVVASARDGATVSFHTQMEQTATALRTLIPLFLAEGYQFTLVC